MIIEIIVAVVLVSALVIVILLVTAPEGEEIPYVGFVPKTGGKEK